MTIDMTNNRVPYGLLTDAEKAALYNHKGEFMSWSAGHWVNSGEVSTFYSNVTYRPLPVEKTQDVIAWEKLPDWVEWVARDSDGKVFIYDAPPDLRGDSIGTQAVRDLEAKLAECEARLSKAVEALVSLEKQASTTSSRGAVTGLHWTHLTVAILKARATLAEIENSEAVTLGEKT
jgi:hypothetical protein